MNVEGSVMLQARNIMQADVTTVGPGLSVMELEQLLAQKGVSGAPVVEADELVGVVSRTDIVRALTDAEGGAEATLAYYQDVAGADPEPAAAARMAGERLAAMAVRDIMKTELIAVSAEHPVREIAGILVARRMHRVLVTEGRHLVGLVTTLDLVRAIADGRFVESQG